jgi:DNA-binding GntR family transcriptional regulator
MSAPSDSVAGSPVSRSEPLVRTMSGHLSARIRERILAGAYAPGAQLLQDNIAAEFGVSKIPVREALVQLRSEGLVDIFAHRGFQVRAISVSEFEEVFGLRLQIEPAAVALGARKASQADRDAARAALGKLNGALGAQQLNQAGDLNREFHLALIVPALQPVTAETLGRLHTLSQRYIQMHLSPRGRIKGAAREHQTLLTAWLSGKHREAAALTREHIESTREDLAKLVR